MRLSSLEIERGWRGPEGSGPPLVIELRSQPDMLETFHRVRTRRHSLFLDSALRRPQIGRYSFLCADPFEWWTLTADELALQAGQQLPLFGEWPSIPDQAQPGKTCSLSRILQRYRTKTVANLPPFQGGVAGLFAYDMNRSLERILAPRNDEFQTPALAIGLYDWVIAFDHEQQRAWLISQGFPETEPGRRRERAVGQAEQVLELLERTIPNSELPSSESRETDPMAKLAATQLVPQFQVAGSSDLTSNFSMSSYHQAVQQAIDYIHAGDIFQVNLAQRLLYPACDDSANLYLRLRSRNPATFAAYFDLGQFQLLSASPERFLSIRNGWVETRPIKGTRQRIARPEADLFAADELSGSEKDRAENVMIVDLLRNDLSRVCRPDSVQVSQLCRVEVYEFVQHLVSVVRGALESQHSALAAVAAAFPGGSITGAPKVRAMQIIRELEPTARGPYCGSLGYIGFDGTTDLNILIRTITAGRGWWQMPVGGGIVAQSQPAAEYEETWHKARGLLRSLEGPAK